MSDRSVRVNESDRPWESDDGDPDSLRVLRWRRLIAGELTPTSGLSMGTFEVPPGAELALHRHRPPEVYYVTEGAAEVFCDGEWRPLRRGDAVYQPGDSVHGVRNRGEERVVIVWMFPTDTYEEIEYVDA